jgi:hypothetical protein
MTSLVEIRTLRRGPKPTDFVPMPAAGDLRRKRRPAKTSMFLDQHVTIGWRNVA